MLHLNKVECVQLPIGVENQPLSECFALVQPHKLIYITFLRCLEDFYPPSQRRCILWQIFCLESCKIMVFFKSL